MKKSQDSRSNTVHWESIRHPSQTKSWNSRIPVSLQLNLSWEIVDCCRSWWISTDYFIIIMLIFIAPCHHLTRRFAESARFISRGSMFQIWLAWDDLIVNSTLTINICESITSHGYVFRSFMYERTLLPQFMYKRAINGAMCMTDPTVNAYHLVLKVHQDISVVNVTSINWNFSYALLCFIFYLDQTCIFATTVPKGVCLNLSTMHVNVHEINIRETQW